MVNKAMVGVVLFMVAVFLSWGGTGVAQAATNKPAAPVTPAESTETKKVFDAHDTGVRYHFNDTDMDFNFGTTCTWFRREPWCRNRRSLQYRREN